MAVSLPDINKILQEKIVDELPRASALALSKLLKDPSTHIDPYVAYSIFVDYFPEILAGDEGMSIDDIMSALYTYDDGHYSVFDEWIDVTNLDEIFVDTIDPEHLSFTDVVAILSVFLYDYEYQDMREDCGDLAVRIARDIYN